MDNKKDIYNLWVQYTTKNEESYFREFIERFVAIWQNQLSLDFTSPKCLFWYEVQPDSGPHLGRLPDELLPAIGKFIIVASDQCQNGNDIAKEIIQQITLLIDCLVIICRHFDNILAIIKYEYKSNLISILTNVFQQTLQQKCAGTVVSQLFHSFSQFLEVMYDPYLTWRSYLRNAFADYKKLSYKPHDVHVEIIPFIYDCFQQYNINRYPVIGECLIHALGAIICGSQKCIVTQNCYNDKTTTGDGDGSKVCDNVRNGMRAICPATVSVVMKILSQWECASELRVITLRCCALMIIVLQKSSPEERQIDLVTLIKLYCDVLDDLMKTKHFQHNSDDAFHISSDGDANGLTIDVKALEATVNNVCIFLSDATNAAYICEAIEKTQLTDLLISIPKNVKNWNLHYNPLIVKMLNALAAITRNSTRIISNLCYFDKISKLFDGLTSLYCSPANAIIEACITLAYNDEVNGIVLPEVFSQLLKWLPAMDAEQQDYLSEKIHLACVNNYATKSIACENRIIKTLCDCLQSWEKLTQLSIQNCIKLIEELSKVSILPIELKCLFSLLRKESAFPQSKQLLQTLVTVSLQSLTNNNLCSQYFEFVESGDGIVVTDIKNWSMSGSCGFIFHILLRLKDKCHKTVDVKSKSNVSENAKECSNCRRMLLNLRTGTGTGFEVFIQNTTGNVVVAALTKREYLTSTVNTSTLLDGKWHYVTVAITPPKRPFSYTQINAYVDFMQKLSATLKVQAVNESFIYCSVGSALEEIEVKESTASRMSLNSTLPRSSSQDTTPSYKGMLPSLLERTLSTNVTNYFTLPLRSQTSYDPNVKNFPLGMQETVFGEQQCLNGQVGGVLLAEPTTNLKTIFDVSLHFASIFSQDNDILELTTRFVFCYSPAAYMHNTCVDLIPGGKYMGLVQAQHYRVVKIQDTINSVGGIQAILPILHHIVKDDKQELEIVGGTSDNETHNSCRSSLEQQAEDEKCLKSPLEEELYCDWEIVSSNSYTEWKISRSPVASFICFLRYLIHEHDNNQENLLNTECLSIMGMMLQKCSNTVFDVNALMAIHLLIESLQGYKSSSVSSQIHSAILDNLYTNIIFNFDIWIRMSFQITLGHVQYLSAMIKNDRKYFRKKFGVQYFLDVTRTFYSTPVNITAEDAKTIRSTLYGIVRFYLIKDVNIKEILAIVSFLASVKQDDILIEFLDMMSMHIKSKNCRDQLILLMHEPQTANLLYNYFIDKTYSCELQEAAIRLISSLLDTSRVHPKYKRIMRLYDPTTDVSLFPGLFSYVTPMMLTSTIIFHMFDGLLSGDVDYCGLIFLVHHVSSCELPVKLEVAKRLLQTTFVKQQTPHGIAKQVGWQESIARLLIRRPITNVQPDDEKRKSFGINLDVLLEDEPEFSNSQGDLISFCEQTIDRDHSEQTDTDGVLRLNEIQASVTEAANALETEIKELAESVSGAVVENVSSVFSVIRQTTYDIQDTFESLTMGASMDTNDEAQPTKQSNDSLSSDSSTQSPSAAAATAGQSASIESNLALSGDSDVDSEEQLVYLVSNILFTIFWRGVTNEHPDCWKERGQVLGCINLLALNNELVTSHLTLRLKILEMATQASLFDLAEHGNQILINQENASYILRMVYDLVVLGSNEDDTKKCSTKLLDSVLALLDALMVFQQDASADWSEMVHLCLGLLLKCSHHPNPGVVAMATAKLHAILQCRNTENPSELAYLLFSINRALDNAIEVGNPEEYSFLMPVMKALLEKCYNIFNLSINLPDLPPTTAGPVFFHDFQMYSTSKKWKNFMEKIVQPLYDAYQREVEMNLWEPINRYWAECYEACKLASKKRMTLQADNRTLFQKKILLPWRVHQVEETARLHTAAVQQKSKCNHIKKKWKCAKRFLYGPRGPWFTGETPEESWSLSNHENTARMRLKLEPQLYPQKHENASNLRDNAANTYDAKEMPEFDTTIKNVVVRDFLANDDNSQLEEDLRITLESQTQQDVTLEKLIISQDCELITLMTKVKGRIEVNHTVFTFVDLSPATEDGSKNDFRFSINKIREVHLRKYNLRRSALEIFLIDQTSYFLNFTTKTRNKIFSKILSLQPPNILYGSGRSPAEVLKTSGLTQKWLNREISNFEYLMYLNTIAGRSYNDLSQYPVFPWILADYTSDVLDLTDPKSFRDLSKPIGVVNPKNETEVRSKYDSFEDPSGAIPKFHYGTHYSNSAGVLHYLLRVEPFTSLHIELQSGRFDVADRQFHSIPQTWKLLMDNPNDVKELIPEFFYFPEFLKNMNKFDLGHLQITKEKVDDVILPAWANTPEEFIAIHRRALESEFVSQNLHHWIDLIFGYKQKGAKAVEALNVFYYCSYEGAVDLDKINNPVEREAVEGMINNFGQVPSQLMREPHPRRLTHEETAIKLLKAELKRPDLMQFLDRIVQYYIEISTPKDPVMYLSPPRSPPRSFLQLSPDMLVSISKSCILGCNSWMSHDKEKGFLLEVDATTANFKNRKRIFGPLHPSQAPHSQLFAISTDGKLVYVGGIWDNSLRVYSLHKGKSLASVTRHLDIITCLALDNCGSYLVTGSRDCTCIIWSIQSSHTSNINTSSTAANNIAVHTLTGQTNLQSVMQLNTQNNYSPKPLTTLYGHDDAISSVAIYTELDMVCSGSVDGTVNVYTIQDGQFVRTLKPIGCTDNCVQISYVTLSYHGHIAFSALDDTSHSIHVYSINGTNLGSKYVSGRVTGLATASDYLIVTDDAGDITISRLHGLKPVFDIPLHVPIQTVVVTPGNTHILAPLRDGRLAVVAIHIPLTHTKKHSVLNV